MKKYSKDNLKKRRFDKFLIILLAIIIILSLSLLIYILLNNNITYEKVDDSAKFISNDETANSTPIIVDNVLIGGLYDKKWVSAEKYYLGATNKSDIEIDVYNKTGKKGAYNIESISKGDTTTVYSITTNTNLVDEYFAIPKNDSANAMLIPAKKRSNITEEEIKNVEKALGIYRLFNTTVKITEVYDISLSQGNNGMLIFATNQVGKSFGVYSAVVYVDNQNKPTLIKYSYVRDKNNASNWPIYSFKFTGDLNLDGTYEIIIQETKEFEVKYDVIEYNNKKFKEVLSTVIK